MSLNPLWVVVHQKAATKHFNTYDFGVPWEWDEALDGEKLSMTFLEPSAMRINSEEHQITFKVRIVCTISTEGLYDLGSLAGSAATSLLDPIIDDDVCVQPVLEKIDIKLFDFKHGYKQALMEQIYTSRLRG